MMLLDKTPVLSDTTLRRKQEEGSRDTIAKEFFTLPIYLSQRGPEFWLLITPTPLLSSFKVAGFSHVALKVAFPSQFMETSETSQSALNALSDIELRSDFF